MEPNFRMLTIRLIEKINLDKETAGHLQIADVSRYREEGKEYEKISKKSG